MMMAMMQLLVRCPNGQQFLTIINKSNDITIESLSKQISNEAIVVGVELAHTPGLQKKFQCDNGESSYFLLPGYAKVNDVLNELDLIYIHEKYLYKNEIEIEKIQNKNEIQNEKIKNKNGQIKRKQLHDERIELEMEQNGKNEIQMNKKNVKEKKKIISPMKKLTTELPVDNNSVDDVSKKGNKVKEISPTKVPEKSPGKESKPKKTKVVKQATESGVAETALVIAEHDTNEVAKVKKAKVTKVKGDESHDDTAEKKVRAKKPKISQSDVVAPETSQSSAPVNSAEEATVQPIASTADEINQDVSIQKTGKQPKVTLVKKPKASPAKKSQVSPSKKPVVALETPIDTPNVSNAQTDDLNADVIVPATPTAKETISKTAKVTPKTTKPKAESAKPATAKPKALAAKQDAPTSHEVGEEQPVDSIPNITEGDVNGTAIKKKRVRPVMTEAQKAEARRIRAEKKARELEKSIKKSTALDDSDDDDAPIMKKPKKSIADTKQAVTLATVQKSQFNDSDDDEHFIVSTPARPLKKQVQVTTPPPPFAKSSTIDALAKLKAQLPADSDSDEADFPENTQPTPEPVEKVALKKRSKKSNETVFQTTKSKVFDAITNAPRLSMSGELESLSKTRNPFAKAKTNKKNQDSKIISI